MTGNIPEVETLLKAQAALDRQAGQQQPPQTEEKRRFDPLRLLRKADQAESASLEEEKTRLFQKLEAAGHTVDISRLNATGMLPFLDQQLLALAGLGDPDQAAHPEYWLGSADTLVMNNQLIAALDNPTHIYRITQTIVGLLQRKGLFANGQVKLERTNEVAPFYSLLKKASPFNRAFGLVYDHLSTALTSAQTAEQLSIQSRRIAAMQEVVASHNQKWAETIEIIFENIGYTPAP